MKWEKPNFGPEIKKAKKEALGSLDNFLLKKLFLSLSIKKETTSLDEEELTEYENIKKLLERGIIKVQTLPELRQLLEDVGLETKEINEIMAHENAHANKAEELGGNFEGYALLFKKHPFLKYLIGKNISTEIITKVNPSEDWKIEQKKDFINKVMQAPHDSKNNLSKHSKKK